MADPGINYTITTTANTAALVEATTGIARMSEAESNLAAKRAGFLSASEREVAEIKRLSESARKASEAQALLAESTKKTTTAMTADTAAILKTTEAMRKLAAATETSSDKAKVASFAHYDLDAKFKKVAEVVPKITNPVATMGSGMGKMGMLANQASFQVGDFFTQVEMGTSKMRAFSQQAPQLIGAFQMSGLLSGPMGLALAGISVALPMIALGFNKITGAAKETVETVQQIGEAAKEAAEQTIAAEEEQAEARWEAAQAVIQNWAALKAAQAATASAALAADEEMLNYQEKLNIALGRNIDLSQQRLELEQRRRAQDAADQAAPAIQAAEEAAMAVQAARRRVNNLEGQKGQQVGDAVAASATVGAWNQELERLRNQQRNAPSPAESGSWSPASRSLTAGQVKANADLDQRISGLEELIAKMSGERDAATQAAQRMQAKIETAENAFQKAAADGEDKAAAAAESIALAEAQLKQADKSAELDKVTENMRQRAGDIDAVLAEITPLNTSQQQALERVKGVTKDGIAAADETATLANNLGQLIGGLQTSQSTTTANVRELIATMSAFQRQQQIDAAAIRSLRSKAESPYAR